MSRHLHRDPGYIVMRRSQRFRPVGHQVHQGVSFGALEGGRRQEAGDTNQEGEGKRPEADGSKKIQKPEARGHWQEYD